MWESVCVLTLNLKLRAKKSSFIKRLSIFYCRNKIARKKYLVDQSNFSFGQFFGSVAKTLPTFDQSLKVTQFLRLEKSYWILKRSCSFIFQVCNSNSHELWPPGRAAAAAAAAALRCPPTWAQPPASTTSSSWPSLQRPREAGCSSTSRSRSTSTEWTSWSASSSSNSSSTRQQWWQRSRPGLWQCRQRCTDSNNNNSSSCGPLRQPQHTTCRPFSRSPLLVFRPSGLQAQLGRPLPVGRPAAAAPRFRLRTAPASTRPRPAPAAALIPDRWCWRRQRLCWAPLLAAELSAASPFV